MTNREKDSELVEIEAPLSDAQTLHHLISGEPRPTISMTRREFEEKQVRGFKVLGAMIGLGTIGLFGYHALTSSTLQEFYQPFLEFEEKAAEIMRLRPYLS